ncbi:hypothetical protein BD289DRAFT_188262 [Coniella lustricola]|uniref:Uncharacterized protein n=1 Tax=Coniella lustricola TaxID=2025994 RepID=A0A2T2ZSX9_9PEZI|nr:hypothetical protein BD289DRAFT_188262 [Coniella lustricola]
MSPATPTITLLERADSSPRDEMAILLPEILELSEEDGMTISSQAAPGKPIYSLNCPIIAVGPRAGNNTANNNNNDDDDDEHVYQITFSRHYLTDPNTPKSTTTTITVPLFHLNRHAPATFRSRPQQAREQGTSGGPSATSGSRSGSTSSSNSSNSTSDENKNKSTNEYYLSRLASTLPGNIQFEGPFSSTSASTSFSCSIPRSSSSRTTSSTTTAFPSASLPCSPSSPASATTSSSRRSSYTPNHSQQSTAAAAVSNCSFNAHLHPGKSDTDPDPFSPAPVFFLHMRTRWLQADEYNFLDTEGRQVACEEVGVSSDGGGEGQEGMEEFVGSGSGGDGGGVKTRRRLVVTRAMPAVLRECLVAIWCLRMWMGTEEARAEKRER